MLSRLVYYLVLLTALSVVINGANAQGLVTAQTSQNSVTRGVTLDLKDVTLERALSEIARQANMRLVYNDAAVSLDQKTTFHAVNMSIGSALAVVLKGTGLDATFAHDGGTIVIAKRDMVGTRKSQGTITGKIVDAKSGKGISSANVSVDNSANGAISDEDGLYRLSGVSAGVHTVSVRLVGYAKQTRSITVGDGASVTVDFKLEPSANVLSDVVVTGTVVSTELKAVPSAITVITAKQIEERGITKIEQLFRGDVPGVFASNVGAEATFDEIAMYSRGATALSSTSIGTNGPGGFMFTNPIKTYLDGVELSDPKYLNQIDPASIERIEILTGPQASTIYGSNAINGVMQIFTKRGNSVKPRLNFNLSSGVTQNNFTSAVAPEYVTDLNASGTEGAISYSLGSSWNYIGEWTASKQTQRWNTNGGTHGAWGKFSMDISARHGFTQTKTRGVGTAGDVILTQSGVYRPGGATGLASPTTSALYGNTIGITLGYRVNSWWSHRLTVGRDASGTTFNPWNYKFASRSDTTVLTQDNNGYRTSQSYSSTIEMGMTSFMHLNLTYGADHWQAMSYASHSISPDVVGILSSGFFQINHSAKNTGAYVQGQFALKDALFLTYGLREDWNPDYGDKAKVTPGRYGLSFVHDVGPVSLKLRGSYGQATRPPGTGLKLSVPVEIDRPGDFQTYVNIFGEYDSQLANPDLIPEYQQGGEGGMELYFGNKASLIVTRYNQTVNNLISSVVQADSVRALLPGGNIFCPAGSSCIRSDGYYYWYQSQYLNVGSIRNQGWELQGSVNTGPITTHATYSWTKSRVIGITPKYRSSFSSQPEFTVGRSFDFSPEHTAALGFTYARAATNVSLNITGVGLIYRNTFTEQDQLNLTRLLVTLPWQTIPNNYRPLAKGYTMADLAGARRLNNKMDVTVNVQNLTNYYRNDSDPRYPTAGRQTRLGFRWRIN